MTYTFKPRLEQGKFYPILLDTFLLVSLLVLFIIILYLFLYLLAEMISRYRP
ncbi:hypothetical protein KKC1_33320 [Calderihabitans maritimus]|uniref:Uncharacterized protein n=1 Tax=Calderihabitans maritimus TaxID=1246530 RepID=A0A1Z5HY51_9FIRM|nr:hypothetical protein KKC1_33320 [Calderihabitans maritimus]